MAMLARTARIPCQDLARTPVLGPRGVEAGEAECLRSSERIEEVASMSPSTGVLAWSLSMSSHGVLAFLKRVPAVIAIRATLAIRASVACYIHYSYCSYLGL